MELIQLKNAIEDEIQRIMKKKGGSLFPEPIPGHERLSDHNDIASSTTDRDLQISLDRRDMMRLEMLNRALYRIAIGNYGICEKCNEPISEERLQLNPIAVIA